MRRRGSSARSGTRWAAGSATIRFQPLGSVQVVTGTSPHRQGHETAWAQIVADELGVDIDDVEVLHGDTAVSQLGMDTYGSRSLTVGGIALWNAGQKVIEKARAIVAHQLEVSEADLEFVGGTFSVKARRTVAWGSRTSPSRRTRRTTCPTGWSRVSRRRPSSTRRTSRGPAGHAAVVEVDTETGDASPRYVAVDDVGNPVNPMIVDGQVHGGITQGIAAALYEEGAYDSDGNLRRRR